MLVGAGDSRVHPEVPGDQSLGVGPGLQLLEDAVPGAVPLPTPEQPVHRLPWTVPLGHVPPGSTSAGAPAYAVYQLPFGVRRWPAGLLPGREQGLQLRPLGEARPRARLMGQSPDPPDGTWDTTVVTERLGRGLE
jgi:hypothetical protein